MSVFTEVVTYSGWVGTLVGVAYIVVQRVEGRRDKDQKEQLSELLARLSTEPVLLGADSESSRTSWPVSSTRTERIRSVLIRAAAGQQTLQQVCRQVQDFGCDQTELMQAARALANSGLLQFEEPLKLDSTLTLKV